MLKGYDWNLDKEFSCYVLKRLQLILILFKKCKPCSIKKIKLECNINRELAKISVQDVYRKSHVFNLDSLKKVYN